MILNIKIRAEKDVSVIENVLSLLQEYDVQEIKWDEGNSTNVVAMAAPTDEQGAVAAVQQAARAQIQQSGRWTT